MTITNLVSSTKDGTVMDGVHYRAKAPLRIGLVGGGTDVNPYASEKGGMVFNTTINKYAYCTITPTGDSSMSIHSTDYGKYEAPLDGGPLPLDGNMDLIKAVSSPQTNAPAPRRISRSKSNPEP